MINKILFCFFLSLVICLNFSIVDVYCNMVNYRVFFIWLISVNGSVADFSYQILPIPFVLNISLLFCILFLIFRKIKIKLIWVFFIIFLLCISLLYLYIASILADSLQTYGLGGQVGPILKESIRVIVFPYVPSNVCTY